MQSLTIYQKRMILYYVARKNLANESGREILPNNILCFTHANFFSLHRNWHILVTLRLLMLGVTRGGPNKDSNYSVEILKIRYRSATCGLSRQKKEWFLLLSYMALHLEALQASHSSSHLNKSKREALENEEEKCCSIISFCIFSNKKLVNRK